MFAFVVTAVFFAAFSLDVSVCLVLGWLVFPLGPVISTHARPGLALCCYFATEAAAVCACFILFVGTKLGFSGFCGK